jgi:hypothetical protein
VISWCFIVEVLFLKFSIYGENMIKITFFG